MNINMRRYRPDDEKAAVEIWNTVVEDGVAFPQIEGLKIGEGNEFFLSQTYTGIAEDTDSGDVVGLYILHPNNIGRCGHIANASYAVRKDVRGEHIGEKVVLDCLEIAKEKGFKIMQFNAVVATNIHALHLYKRLGFTRLGTIPGGFKLADGSYEDIVVHYKTL